MSIVVSDMDWELLEQRKVRPPFRPRVVSSLCESANLNIFLKHLFLQIYRKVHVMLSISTPSLLVKIQC